MKMAKENSSLLGDLVYLKLQSYRQKSLPKSPNEKLPPRYYGPFAILQKTGSVAYKLNLPSNSKIHHVFHIYQLKTSLGFLPSSSSLPLFLPKSRLT